MKKFLTLFFYSSDDWCCLQTRDSLYCWPNTLDWFMWLFILKLFAPQSKCTNSFESGESTDARLYCICTTLHLHNFVDSEWWTQPGVAQGRDGRNAPERVPEHVWRWASQWGYLQQRQRRARHLLGTYIHVHCFLEKIKSLDKCPAISTVFLEGDKRIRILLRLYLSFLEKTLWLVIISTKPYQRVNGCLIGDLLSLEKNKGLPS